MPLGNVIIAVGKSRIVIAPLDSRKNPCWCARSSKKVPTICPRLLMPLGRVADAPGRLKVLKPRLVLRNPGVFGYWLRANDPTICPELLMAVASVLSPFGTLIGDKWLILPK